MPDLKETDFSPSLFETAKDKGSVHTFENLYNLLGNVVHSQETDLNNAIGKLADSGSNIDQGALLRVQGMVQSWAVTSGLATGTLRAAGDALSRTTQSIR
ncbi:MAG: hypothetical protein LBB38_01275 [Puniceicoccales bacterium]|jgi:hypothetical protein|nr:hypothetical protein [Puniceicoccales bacterium]